MIKKNILFTLALIMGFTVTGCTAPGAKFTALQNVGKSNSEVIVYRKKALFAIAQSMPVLIDGNKSGELYNASFLQLTVTPGDHSITVTTGMFGKPAEAAVKLAAGERKFMQFEFPTGVMANPYFIGITLTERSEADALADLKELSSANPLVTSK